MRNYRFASASSKQGLINTKFRKIATEIPVPESISIFNDLDKYESMAMRGQLPVVWDRAEGFQVFDKYGNCWIDFTSTIFVANAGHSNPKVISALRDQLDHKLLHTYTFVNEARLRFLKKLIDITPSFCEKAFLLSAGTEATECAVKLMRMRGRSISPDKVGIISFRDSMYGRTMAAEMLKGNPDLSSWIGYLDPNIHHIPFPYPWDAGGKPRNGHDWRGQFHKDIALLTEKKVDFNKICGFIIESYQGWAAALFPEEYILELADFAGNHDILITFDEVQGGFGRTGKLFAYQHYSVEPDLLCLGKALGGSLPVSAVVGRKEIMDLPDYGSMSSTHSANPLCCTAALANIEEIESKNMVKESARKGKILHEGLNGLKNKYPDCISYVLGRGLLAALIVTDPLAQKPDSILAGQICENAMRRGLLLVRTGREAVKIGPPLIIPDEAIAEGISVIDECFQEIRGRVKVQT